MSETSDGRRKLGWSGTEKQEAANSVKCVHLHKNRKVLNRVVVSICTGLHNCGSFFLTFLYFH
jgi:hypothetical protein